MNKKSGIYVGLDLGTSKVVVIVCEISPKGLQVIGIGMVPSEGLKNGMVINIGKTVDSIKKAVKVAEQMAGCQISAVIVGMGGPHIMGVNNSGMINVPKKEITIEDRERVIDSAKACPISVDRSLIYIIPQQYNVDGQGGIKDPVGISGVRLEVDAHLICGSASAIDNILKCIERSGLKAVRIVPNPLASAFAVLDDNEKELGVACIDIGAGTSGITIWINDSLVYTGIISKGGYQITEDIGKGLRTPMVDAENIKIKFGYAMSDLIEENEMIDIPGVGGRPKKTIRRQILTDLIEARMEEILCDCYTKIQESGLDDLLGAGIVITGGTSGLPGIEELGKKLMGLPVRTGVPKNVKGLNDLIESGIYSTAYGLLLCEEKIIDKKSPVTLRPVILNKEENFIKKYLKKAVNFLFSI